MMTSITGSHTFEVVEKYDSRSRNPQSPQTFEAHSAAKNLRSAL
jgi:hypothetical protein